MQKKTALLAAAFTLSSTQVFAARPLFTDDAGTLGKGRSQIEVGMQTRQEKDIINGKSDRWNYSTASGTVTHGLSDKIDLVAEVPFQWYTHRQNGQIMDENSAIGDISMHVKWRFYEKEDSWFTLALKPGLIIPTGDEKKGFGNGKLCEELVLIASREAELLSTHVNLGYTHNAYVLESDRAKKNNHIWKASFGGELNLIGKLKLVGDIGIETSPEKDAEKNQSYVLGGAVLGLDKDTDIDFGMRKELNKGETNTNVTVIAGFTMHY